MQELLPDRPQNFGLAWVARNAVRHVSLKYEMVNDGLKGYFVRNETLLWQFSCSFILDVLAATVN
jgi:hypothetical protein